MSWFWLLLIILLLAEVLTLRSKLQSLFTLKLNAFIEPKLKTEKGASDSSWLWLSAAEVSINQSAQEALAHYADDENLDAIDVIPENMNLFEALWFAQAVNFKHYRQQRLTRGDSAGYGVLLKQSLASRMGINNKEQTKYDSRSSFYPIAAMTKEFACEKTDFAVVPGLSGNFFDEKVVYERMRQQGKAAAFTMLMIHAFVLGILGYGLLAMQSGLGLIAFAVFTTAPLLVFLRSPIKPDGLLIGSVFRWPIACWHWLKLCRCFWLDNEYAQASDEQRSFYLEQIETNTNVFFQERLEACPCCGSVNLKVAVKSKDLMQHKPGLFKLEHCGDCGHLFQNPRLSISGLNFYYRDFYDGLGKNETRSLFSRQGSTYLERAEFAHTHLQSDPNRWLDVGAGHGHFCCQAKEVFKETQFDGLDQGENIQAAEERQWIVTAYRDQFFHVAPTITQPYDVVSMFHYLEHTIDPAQEIAAARKALVEKGALVIEVPDPDSALRRLFGRYWLGYLQPQHLHFLNRNNLKRLLMEQGFQPVAWSGIEKAPRTDCAGSLLTWLGSLVAPGNVPWRKANAWRDVLRSLLFLLSTPLIIVALILDFTLIPLWRQFGLRHTFRVIAIKQ